MKNAFNLLYLTRKDVFSKSYQITEQNIIWNTLNRMISSHKQILLIPQRHNFLIAVCNKKSTIELYENER